MAEDLDFEGQFRATLAAVPFVSFTVVLASGDHYFVGDPSRVIVGLDTLTLVEPARTIVIRFFNIVYFELHEQSD
jgi:hypothetical protein